MSNYIETFTQKSPSSDKKKSPKSKKHDDEESEHELDFEIYESDEDDANTKSPDAQQYKSSNLENNDTHITTTTSSDNDIKPNTDIEETKLKETDNISITIQDDEDTKEVPNISSPKTKDVGSKTMENWLNRDNLIVHPVWIGNLPRGTTVNELRRFVESQVGRVLVSIHISAKQQSNERTYAFLNLPTAEKQLLAVTLLDGKIFTEEKLIVRPKRM